KCQFTECGEGEVCFLSGADAECACLGASSCPDDGHPVCGRDSVTYNSDCHLTVTECQTKRTIGKVRDGMCIMAGFCQLQPITLDVAVECNSHIYWDKYEQRCKIVQPNECVPGLYGFSSLGECTEKCSEGKYCEQPLDPGECDVPVTRWQYDSISQDCFSFTYSGCGGNENNFMTRDECLIACPGI
ncbi:BPTI/Kunitz domain-containing protein-like, partial [Saccoglossus kowalevskii]|uniref:Papilin-like n=1 Tax=Saccoglossus kowalevskii TaxID=10224 RepID=A0ABM0LYM9_SACKO